MEAPDFFHDQTVDAFMASAVVRRSAGRAAATLDRRQPRCDAAAANQDGAKDGHVLMMPVQLDYATMSQLLGDATSTTAQLMATVEPRGRGRARLTMSDSGPMISYKAPAPPPPAAPPTPPPRSRRCWPRRRPPPRRPAPAPAAAAPPPAPPQASAAAAAAAASPDDSEPVCRAGADLGGGGDRGEPESSTATRGSTAS